MIVNEAHAWVEVHDGRLWRRIDLGGAGRRSTIRSRTTSPTTRRPIRSRGRKARRAATTSPIARGTRARGARATPPPAPPSRRRPPRRSRVEREPRAGSSRTERRRPDGAARRRTGRSGAGNGKSALAAADDRPPSIVTMSLAGADAHRGAPLKVRGQVSADGEPCGHVSRRDRAAQPRAGRRRDRRSSRPTSAAPTTARSSCPPPSRSATTTCRRGRSATGAAETGFSR